jgi:hypothetical protein
MAFGDCTGSTGVGLYNKYALCRQPETHLFHALHGAGGDAKISIRRPRLPSIEVGVEIEMVF